MCAERMPNPDVLIVGSGIAGALIAWQLGRAGKKVLILEAGEALPPDINGYMNTFLAAKDKAPESPYPPALLRGKDLTDPRSVNAGRPTVLSLLAKGGFGDWTDPKQAYLIQKGPLAFGSTYERINGGTVRHWLGTSLRFVPSDFEMKSRFNRFVDWPIKYRHLERWYGDAEKYIGVSADVADKNDLGIRFSSNYPKPKIPFTRVDMEVEKAMPNLKVAGVGLDGLKWKISSTPAARNSQPYQSRRVCAGNTNCIPICPIQAKYDPTVTLNEALATGRVRLLPRTVASEIAIDGSGRVSAIKYRQYEKEQGTQTGNGTVTGKVFVIAANAIETPRLLLMSKNATTSPKGVANGKDLVGRHLMDHPYYVVWGRTPNQVWPYRGPLITSGIEGMRDG